MDSQGQNKAPELLYHYTSVSALYNMLVHLTSHIDEFNKT